MIVGVRGARGAARRRAALAAAAAVVAVALALAAWNAWRTTSAVHAVVEERAQRMAAGERRALARAVRRAARDHGVPPLLVLALIEQESHFDPRARGRRGGRGLMQVRPRTARHVAERLGVDAPAPDDLFDPGVNVAFGTAYLKELETRFGTWELALAAYNSGPTHVATRLRNGRQPRMGYASSVVARWREHEQRLGM